MFNELEKQLNFLREIDQLKTIFRQTFLIKENRRENDAEHSWHFAMYALILQSHANEQVDILKVIQMALIHDLVEIDAGDALVYDEKARELQKEKELLAAERIFSLLPDQQKKMINTLWKEFENGNSKEAKFARALDRLQPIMNNFHSEGKAWKNNGIKKSQVLEKNKHVADGSKLIWQFIESIVEKSVEKGYLLNE